MIARTCGRLLTAGRFAVSSPVRTMARKRGLYAGSEVDPKSAPITGTDKIQHPHCKHGDQHTIIDITTPPPEKLLHPTRPDTQKEEEEIEFPEYTENLVVRPPKGYLWGMGAKLSDEVRGITCMMQCPR